LTQTSYYTLYSFAGRYISRMLVFAKCLSELYIADIVLFSVGECFRGSNDN